MHPFAGNLISYPDLPRPRVSVKNRVRSGYEITGNLPCVTIHLEDANPDDIQFFIDELPFCIKGKTG